MNKVAACDTPPPFLARVEAAEKVNSDPSGRPLPTWVQFLQVKDSIKLERASFQQLSTEPKALLGEDLLQTAEFVVKPGDAVEHRIQRDPKARFVAAVGIFRKQVGSTWLAVARLPDVTQSQCETPPPDDGDDPSARDDTQLLFKLQHYQIDFLRSPRSMR